MSSSSNKITREILMDFNAEEIVQRWEEKKKKLDELDSRLGGATTSSTSSPAAVAASAKTSLMRRLNTDLSRGLTNQQVKKMRDEFGDNKMPESPIKTFYEMFVESFEDETLRVLIFAAFISFVIGVYDSWKENWSKPSYMEGVSIFIAIFLVAGVTSWNNYRKEMQFQKLNEASEDVMVRVIRDNAERNDVKSTELVVGDILRISTGDKIPADGIMIEAETEELHVDEAAITGEPEPRVKSTDKDCFLISSTSVNKGECKMLVIAVGRSSYDGAQRAKLQEPKEQNNTPLQEKLDTLAGQIGQIGQYAAIATFVVMAVLWYVKHDVRIKSIDKNFANSSGESDILKSLKTEYNIENIIEIYWNKFFFKYVLDAFIMAVTIVVVAVPEGLPLAVTLSLSYSTMKMMDDNNLIRVLDAVETMGNATALCSDKTGTLTKGEMNVTAAYFNDKKVDEKQLTSSSVKISDILLINMTVNNTAELTVDMKKNSAVREMTGGKVKGDALVGSGNSSEVAMLKLLKLREEKDYKLTRGEWKVAVGNRFPYDSDRKCSSVFATHTNSGRTVGFVKGGHDTILKMCKNSLDSKKFAAIENEGRNYGKEGKRVFAFAHYDFSDRNKCKKREDIENREDLIFDGMICIHDPLREQSRDAVLQCQAAGIVVRMITGDYIETAKAIAAECGILTQQGEAIEGETLRNLVAKGKEIDQRLVSKIPKYQIIARATPNDKNIIVKHLQHMNQVVGVTGDGTNDAQALRTADVGLAMMSGTDVAKDAADIIIMDNNFASIIKAVEWGRCTFDNIRKFLQFQLTVNAVALIFTFIAAVKGEEPPLNAVMMLWVNLIMDTFGALALGTESPNSEKLLKRMPFKKDASLISFVMAKNIIMQAVFQLGVLLFLQSERGCEVFDCNSQADKDLYTNTIIFNVFVLCQVFNEFNSRSIDDDDSNILYGLTKNFTFLFIIAITVFVQYVIVTYGGVYVKTTPIAYKYWVKCYAIAAVSILVGWLMRLINITEYDKSDFIELDDFQRKIMLQAREKIKDKQVKSGKVDMRKQVSSWLYKIFVAACLPVAIAYLWPRQCEEYAKNFLAYFSPEYGQ